MSLDNLPEILCLISYLKVSSFMWLFRSHYLAKVGQNWLNWQNCLNGDINKAPPSPRTQFAWQYVGWGKKHLVAIWAWSMVKFLWWCDGDVFFLSDAIPMFFGHLLTLLLMRLFGLKPELTMFFNVMVFHDFQLFFIISQCIFIVSGCFSWLFKVSFF